MFPYRQCELVFRDAPFISLSCHRRAVSADAGVGEQCLPSGRGEGRG
jgi:hypothetical protein